MAGFGKNMMWTVDEKHREQLNAMFRRGFGCSVEETAKGWERYEFKDGGGVGVNYVSTPSLSKEQNRVAPWLEFLVDDVPACVSVFDDLGIEKVPFDDPDHPYFQAPGGPVFRLERGR